MELNLSKKRISSVALISFADVIFLLLIFLLISSSFITHSGIKVNLPSSTTQQNEYNRNISLTITQDDELYVDDVKVTWETLPTVLNQRLIDDPEQVVIVRADQDIALKRIVRLLDVAKLSGRKENDRPEKSLNRILSFPSFTGGDWVLYLSRDHSHPVAASGRDTRIQDGATTYLTRE